MKAISRAALAGIVWLSAAGHVFAQEAQSFLFVGDMPYSSNQIARFNSVIAPAIRSSDFPFLVHYGDLKGSGVPCTDTLIRDAHTQITGLWGGGSDTGQHRPVFYTPGDNEWTDCDRRFADGGSRSELQSLDLLRRVFFIEKPLRLSESWQYEWQPLFPENATWRSEEIQFATVHLVGTNNGRLEILMDDVGVALAQVDARDQANREWLNRVFSRAKSFRDPATAVIIATQADVTNPDESAPCTPSNPMNCDAYAGFRAQLTKHAASFRKPVLLVHGDTFPYCFDRKFGGPKAPNLWRLNAGGDYYQPLDATVVTYHPGHPDNPFTARGLVEGKAPSDGC